MNCQKALSLADVQELADSCRITLTQEELIKYRGDLNDLLELVSVLEESRTEEEAPVGRIALADLRPDGPARPSASREETYWVPSVLER